MRRIIIIILAFAVLLPAAMGRRTATDIKRERQATERKIKNTQTKLNANVDDTRRQLNRLTSLQGDIRNNDSRIIALRSRNDSLQRITDNLADSVKKTSDKVERLKRSRAAALRAARRQRQTAGSATAFLFSSESFRQAMRRASYLHDLARWQDSSATSLTREIRVLENRRARLDSARAVLKAGLDDLTDERRLLEQNTREAKAVVASLKRQSRNLEKVLAEQRRQAERLDRELNRLIEEEARRAAEEERRKREQQPQPDTKPTKPVPGKSKPVTPVKPGTPFASMKGRLPLPLDHAATVAVPFGLQTHAEYSKVKMQNNGIDLETAAGASARAVHEGTVSMIIVMEGYHNVVLVRHGEYLTVYAGLADLAVKKGQHLNAGDRIGTVYVDRADGDRTRLHFEVRHEKEKLDPAQWLRLR